MRARLDPILELLQPVTHAFAKAGHRLYLVGGAVRDLFVADDASSDDLDLTTDATPSEVLHLVGPLVHSINRAGEQFGTIICAIGATRLEITTHRREVYIAESRKPKVSFSTRIEDDLARRDFTINAMALELTSPEPTLIDPYHGLEDLLAHQLRTPVSPEVSFREDPLRMLRAARFIARFRLAPEPGLLEAIDDMASRLGILSRERIRDELSRDEKIKK
jgi:poly(A) polymerase